MDRPITLLLVDDDAEIGELLSDYLSRKYNYTVLTAENGKEMFNQLTAYTIDLIILDVMLPGEDGLTLCRKVRGESSIPIIMLTANGEETDRIIGLEMGADDYMAKPFNPRELAARIKAILRRSHDIQGSIKQENLDVYEFAGWRMETASRRLVSPEKIDIILSAGEYALLNTLVTRSKRVLSRDQLLGLLHQRTSGPFDRSVDIQVSRLRQKLGDDPKKPKFIKTVRGGGYLFAPVVKRNA
ncbi:MAG: response regulator [Gammaproteobacteria bacterium]|nr:response regulator [Gammaproteobacteria bacterium]